jgi:hypothetical protein
VLLNFVFTAGTTWLIAVSERSHKCSTNEQYLRNAELCLVMLKEMSPLWESAALLGDMFTRLVNEERERRKKEEERWLITEFGPSGSASASGSDMCVAPRWGGPPESFTGTPVHSKITGRKSQPPPGTSRGHDSYSSEEEGTMGDPQSRLHPRQNEPQQYPPPQHYQQHPQALAPPWQVYGGHNLPSLANPGPSSGSTLPNTQPGHPTPTSSRQPASPISTTDARHAMMDENENDAVCGLKRTGIWMNSAL